MRQIVLDTETTGLDPSQGHRIIEIGCIELMNREVTKRAFHTYINPERTIEAEAIKVHGITLEKLAKEPVFADVIEPLLAFIQNDELIIHNAPFDIGFLNHEIHRLKRKITKINTQCSVLDTLELARKLHPGQRNSLDALCKRYKIDLSERDLHGALLDAKLLAKVYLAMTGGQSSLFAGDSQEHSQQTAEKKISSQKMWDHLPILLANETELHEHEIYLKHFSQK